MGRIIGIATLLIAGCTPVAEVGHTSEVAPWEVAPCSPTSADICNGRDDDCDGEVDEQEICNRPCAAAQVADNCAIRSDGMIWCWRIEADGGVMSWNGDDGQGRFLEIGAHERPPDQISEIWPRRPAGARREDGTFWYPRRGERLERVRTVGFDVAEVGGMAVRKYDGSVWTPDGPPAGARAESRWFGDSFPQPVPLGGPATRLAARGECALLETGSVTCWMGWYGGKLGSPGPAVIPGFAGMRLIAAVHRQVCGATAGGDVFCSGDNFSGQLCDGTTTSTRTATRAVALEGGVLALDVTPSETCALKADGVWCCGGASRLGANDRRHPRRIDLRGAQIVSLGAGCSLTSTGAVLCRRLRLPANQESFVDIEPAVFDLCAAAGGTR